MSPMNWPRPSSSVKLREHVVLGVAGVRVDPLGGERRERHLGRLGIDAQPALSTFWSALISASSSLSSGDARFLRLKNGQVEHPNQRVVLDFSSTRASRI
jgi:hypothetical protein